MMRCISRCKFIHRDDSEYILLIIICVSAMLQAFNLQTFSFGAELQLIDF